MSPEDIARIAARQLEWEAIASAGGEDARLAAKQALRGVIKATGRIHDNLKQLGYPKVAGLIAPPVDVNENIHRIRAGIGRLPAALAEFWREVGGIQLVDVTTYSHLEFWKRVGMRGNDGCCDGVYVEHCSEQMADYCLSEFEDAPNRGRDWPLRVEISPDGLHKDNVSGGAPYGFAYIDGWNAQMLDFQWEGRARPVSAPKGAPDLIAYLRTALLECGGFPGYFGHPGFEQVRMRILQGVEPF